MNRKETFPGMVEFLAPNSPLIPSAAQRNSEKKLPECPIQVSFSHQLRVNCAEYWMKLGEAGEALRELEGLSHSARNHCSVTKTRLAAIAMLRRARKQA